MSFPAQPAAKPGRCACVSLITLGVSDLAASTRFYQELGWINTPASQDSVTFLAGNNIVLGLFGRSDLAGDAHVEDTPSGFRAVALAINLESPASVDACYEAACGAGAKGVKQPQKVFWGGYSGYFADPDGHLWEVAHNPFFVIDENGKLDLLAEAGQ